MSHFLATAQDAAAASVCVGKSRATNSVVRNRSFNQSPAIVLTTNCRLATIIDRHGDAKGSILSARVRATAAIRKAVHQALSSLPCPIAVPVLYLRAVPPSCRCFLCPLAVTPCCNPLLYRLSMPACCACYWLYLLAVLVCCTCLLCLLASCTCLPYLRAVPACCACVLCLPLLLATCLRYLLAVLACCTCLLFLRAVLAAGCTFLPCLCAAAPAGCACLLYLLTVPAGCTC